MPRRNEPPKLAKSDVTDLDRLALTDEQVARLTKPERELRVNDLIQESHAILDYAIENLIEREDREVAGVVILYSGGNDSTVVAHLFKDRATHAAHANTGVGVEETRQFVRDTCAAWGLPLLERMAPRDDDRYRTLVLDQGFPGPGHHYKMFQRLKERALRQVRKELVRRPRKQRVVFIAGRRRQESKRRANIPELEREGSIVWVSPLVNWTKLDMVTYRLIMGDVPVNPVTGVIHMSGECLCGSFAHLNEREEIEFWYPGAFDEIREMEVLIADRDDIPWYRKTWGWGGDPEVLKASRVRGSKSGRLCSSCDARFSEATGIVTGYNIGSRDHGQG